MQSMENEQTYYKIITENAWFKRIYKLGDDLYIPFGTRVVASEPFANDDCYKNGKNGHWYINKPVIHFCDNAFDTMLWHQILTGTIHPKKHLIYQIKPLTPVIKERCSDNLGFYQCGANMIEFLCNIDVNEMFDLAVSDFRKNHNERIKAYPNFQMTKIISDWLHHKWSKYIY